MPVAPVHYDPAAPHAQAPWMRTLLWRIELRGEPARELIIVITADTGEPVARAYLGDTLVAGPSPTLVEYDKPGSLIHLRAHGVVIATLRTPPTRTTGTTIAAPNAPCSLVYAATPLLGALGIPGGTYDPPRLAPPTP